jgi:DUF1707 SHOCT-like domain
VTSGDLRIGDAEREAALHALGEHFSAGRLNVDEYGERSAKVTAAKNQRHLRELFADLPYPHPRLLGDGPWPGPMSPVQDATRQPPPAPTPTAPGSTIARPSRRFVSWAVILGTFAIAFPLLATGHWALIFLLIPIWVASGWWANKPQRNR